jgi:hypothetical protein
MQVKSVGVMLVIVMTVLTACGEPTPAPTPTPAPVVVETGGTALSLSGQGSEGGGSPAGLPAPAGQSGEGAVQADAPSVMVVFGAGDTVVARDILRIYPEANPRAQAMGEYRAPATFVVIEPGSDYDGYPVEVAMVRWYRVRAEDGLVGWAMADGLAAGGE